MAAMRKFLGLSSKDQCFLMGSLLLVVMIRSSLWILPFGLIHRCLNILTTVPTPLPSTASSSTARTVWAVTVTSRYVPGATCLTQALVTQILLARQGYPTNLRIGVAKDKNNKLKAHAWLESQEQIVIGGADSPNFFTPLPTFGGE
jgi:hypothetical protein